MLTMRRVTVRCWRRTNCNLRTLQTDRARMFRYPQRRNDSLHSSRRHNTAGRNHRNTSARRCSPQRSNRLAVCTDDLRNSDSHRRYIWNEPQAELTPFSLHSARETASRTDSSMIPLRQSYPRKYPQKNSAHEEKINKQTLRILVYSSDDQGTSYNEQQVCQQSKLTFELRLNQPSQNSCFS
jgi:hypothetical protein